MLGLPIKSIFHNTVLQHELEIEGRLRHGQKLALRAPVNRSQLRGFDFMVLHAIGRNTWNRYMTSPINSDVYASEQAYQAEAWRDAMQQMRSFYAQAVKRKGVNFENV